MTTKTANTASSVSAWRRMMTNVLLQKAQGSIARPSRGRLTDNAEPGTSVRALLTQGMYGRVRSGIRTGTPAHCVRWQQEAELARAARLTPVTALSGVPSHILLALQNHSGIKNVWDLGHATLDRLLDTPGVGPKRLNQIHAALTARSVPVTWKLPSAW